MNYSKINFTDIANGYGVRVSIFVSGCTNHCEGCFQPETWDFNYGKEFTQETMDLLLNKLEPKFIQGLTILGGEPMDNPEGTEWIIKETRKKFGNKKDIWVYTGYVLKTLLEKKRTEHIENILSNIDMLVAGPFVLEKKTDIMPFRGSTNQRLIDSELLAECLKKTFCT